MLFFTIYKNAALFPDSPNNAVTITRPDVLENLDDILDQIIKDNPNAMVIEIFYRNGDNVTDIATFFDGYIYSSCRQGAQIL